MWPYRCPGADPRDHSSASSMQSMRPRGDGAMWDRSSHMPSACRTGPTLGILGDGKRPNNVPGLWPRTLAVNMQLRDSGEGCLPWCTCRKIDTCGIRTYAGRPHRLSRPTPEPLGQSVHVVGSGAVTIHRLHHRHGWQIAVMAVVCSGATISRSGAGGSSPSGVIRVPQGPAGVEMCRSSQVDVTRLGVGPRAWSRLHACLLVRGLAAQAKGSQISEPASPCRIT